jgi:hypothetical protein
VKNSAYQDVEAPIYYGRAELGDHRVHAEPEDVPLKPGESCFLKIHPGQLDAWDIIRREEGRPYPKNIKIIFQTLSFGDGTGLMGPDAMAVPRKISNTPGPTSRAPDRSRAAPNSRTTGKSIARLRKSGPASFLPNTNGGPFLFQRFSAMPFSTASNWPGPEQSDRARGWGKDRFASGACARSTR